MKQTLVLLTAAVTLLLPGVLRAAESDPAYEFMGFAEDREHFLVKKHEGHEGWSISLRSLTDDRQVRKLSLDHPDNKKRLKAIARKFKLQEGKGPKSPDGDVVVLGVQDERYFDILVMEKPRIGRFKSLKLETDKSGKRPLGEAYLKKAVWSPDGTWLVVIVTEQATGEDAFQRDHVHAFKFRKWKVKWFREEDQ